MSRIGDRAVTDLVVGDSTWLMCSYGGGGGGIPGKVDSYNLGTIN